MAVKVYNVSLNSIRITNRALTVEQEYVDNINANTIDTSKITGSYTIDENGVNFATTAYYSDSSFNLDNSQPYTIILLENTTYRPSQYSHYITFNTQGIGTFKASNSDRYYYSSSTGTLTNYESGSNRRVYFNRWGLHVISVDESRVRWMTYWDGTGPTGTTNNTNILAASKITPLVYSYGYGSEYKESSLKELNAIQRVITVDEELDLVDLMNSRHGLNLWKV